MSIIDPTSPVVNQTSCQYWQDELINSRILLNKIDLAIQTISSGNHQSYKLDTGQSVQTVTRIDLNALSAQRNNLINQIAALELHPCNSNGSNVKQVRPGW